MITGMLLACVFLALMAGAHTINMNLNKGGRYNISNAPLSYNERLGQSGALDFNFELTEGNLSNQANQTFRANYSLAAGGVLNIDLRNGTGTPLDVLNVALSLATVKLAIIAIQNPQANNILAVGPSANVAAGNASGAPLWLGNNTMNETVRDQLYKSDRIAGWTVASGAGNLCIKNIGNATCNFQVRVSGVKA